MEKRILIVRLPIELHEADYTTWFESLKEDYYVFVIYDFKVESIQFEFPKNCDLPQSDLDKIKEAILVK